MYQSIRRQITILPVRNSISRPRLRRSLLLIAIALTCFGLGPAPKAFGVTPAPDGGYPGGNTAEGDNALQNLTTGTYNTAAGLQALYSNTTGGDKKGKGLCAPFLKTT